MATVNGPLLKICQRLGIDHLALTVSILMFGNAMVNTTFMFYYVKVFLEKYYVSEAWFQVVQVLFMVWNSINDPLFGYLQDVGGTWMTNRKKTIYYGTPFLMFSFMLAWFPWGTPGVSPSCVTGIHLLVVLFCYDAAFSFVLLSWCALMAEVSTIHAERVRLVKYNQFATMIGVSVVFFVDKISSSLIQFRLFQASCFAISILAFLCFRYTGLYAPDTVAQVGDGKSTDRNDRSFTWSEAWLYTRQIFNNRNFVVIVLANFCHICLSTAHLNFSAIFTEGLISRDILPLGSWQISLWYGINAVLPQAMVIMYSGLITKYGPHRIVIWCLSFSVCLSLLMYFFIGSDNSILLMVYIGLYRSPLSSLIFSLNALVTKPAQSIAPMVIVYFLNMYGYQSYKGKNTVTTGSSIIPSSDTTAPLELKRCIFTLLCWIPIVLCSVEIFILKFYRLANKHKSAANLAALNDS